MFLNTLSLVEATSENGSNFGVSPIYPSTQDKTVGESGYFKLYLNPGQKEELKTEIKNYSDKDLTILMFADRAVTANSGLILYDTSLNKGSKLKIDNEADFEKMISHKSEEIKLAPKETKTVSLTVETPKKELNGEVLGGLHFKEKRVETKENKKMVTNTFSYSIPIIIQEDEKVIENELSLSTVKPALRNYHPFIEARIENNTPTIIRNMSVDGEIYDTKTEEKRYTHNLQKLQMAPHSAFDFGFDLHDTEIKPGDYEAKLVVNADGKEYQFNQKFSISKEEAAKKNESAVHIPDKEDNTMKYILATIVVLVLIGVAVWLYIRKMKKKMRLEMTLTNDE